MYTEKRTRSIRLNDLKAKYWEELRSRSFSQLEEALQNQILLPHEVEKEIWGYYRRTVSSLQEFYSKYTPEWEVFYESERLAFPDFLIFLQRMSATFSNRYPLWELNVSYYIERLQQCLSKEEKECIQNLFLDRWHWLLTRKEYNYQYHHIESLCDGFVILDKKNGQKTVSEIAKSRLRWLLLNHPQLYRQVVSYEEGIERNPTIQELIRVLGRNGNGMKEAFDSQSGMTKGQLVCHTVQSDIEGITQGDDLNHLLPQEYCLLSEEVLRPLFIRRFLEKQLQVLDSHPLEYESDAVKGEKKSGGQGPFIVCIDTSGSMSGHRERLAKSALLAVAKLADARNRACYVINFSESVQCLAIHDLKKEFPLLADFLNTRFNGGTDIRPAIEETMRLLEIQAWRKADVLLISDFEMPPLSGKIQDMITCQKEKGTSFYSLVFGGNPETDFLHFCTQSWDMSRYCL